MKRIDFIHFFLGLLSGILNAFNPLLGLQAILLFMGYEFLEQLRIHDRSYWDLLMFGLGWSITTSIMVVLGA